MVRAIKLTKRAKKSLRKAPPSVVETVAVWRGFVEEHGIDFVQRIVSFRDHALVGKLKDCGVRSVSLSYECRLFYRTLTGRVECVLVEEINNHELISKSIS
jgi:mRNA-degrading endonuclease YafQ of YafQ-DinJ toxin-antitoxin module